MSDNYKDTKKDASNIKADSQIARANIENVAFSYTNDLNNGIRKNIKKSYHQDLKLMLNKRILMELQLMLKKMRECKQMSAKHLIETKI